MAASLVHIQRAVPAGATLFQALQQIVAGIGILEAQVGLMENSIATDIATFQSTFGINSPEEAQVLYDRIVAFLAVYQNPTDRTWDNLRNLIHANVAA